MDALKIILMALIRHGIVVVLTFLTAKQVLTDEQVSQLKGMLTNAEALAYITAGVITIAVGVITRLRSKLKQKVALELPAGATLEDVKAVVAEQPLKATLTTNPVP